MSSKIWCYCGIQCPVPRQLSTRTVRRHMSAVKKLGGVLVPEDAPDPHSGEPHSVQGYLKSLASNRRLATAAASDGLGKRGREVSDVSGGAIEQPEDAPHSEPTVPTNTRHAGNATDPTSESDFVLHQDELYLDEDWNPPASPPSTNIPPSNERSLDEDINGIPRPFEGDPAGSFPMDGVTLSGAPGPPQIPEALASEDTGMPSVLHIDTLRTSQAFIENLRASKLEDTGMSAEAIECLRHPLQNIPAKLEDDETLRQSLDLWLRLRNAPENLYDSICESFQHAAPTLSHAEIESKVEALTGIYPLHYDMCINSCVAFTGDNANRDTCPECGAHRYVETIDADGKPETKSPKQFLTIPLGPQIQAAWRSKESAEEMSYRRNVTPQILADYAANGGTIPELSDWVHGTEYIEAVQRGDIDENSTTVLLSLDGAQLYESKQSDCWIYIWVLLDRSPDTRYKKPHILIGGIIPGPNKPKNVDSFLFPGFQHLAALMKEGLTIWDASRDRLFQSKLFLAYVTADGPGMQFVNGLVGHSGRVGCRLYCGMPGRHKAGSGIYYPAVFKPDPPYNVAGSTHDDIDLYTIPERPQDDAAKRYQANLRKLATATSNNMYEKYRLETGIAKMTLLSGLPSNCIFGVPNCFPADIMHLAGFNIPDLLISVWRATLPCDRHDDKSTWDWAVLSDDNVWKAHGQAVAGATPYLPGLFDRPPRNIAEKLTSGYKAVEFLTYMYGLAPALLYGILPTKYWQHFCKLVRGIRLVYQRRVSAEQLIEAHQLLLEFAEEYEELYVQRKGSRIHFVRQSIHANTHTAPETFRVGPYGNISQFTLERIIGDLGKDIRQHSNPYANLAKIAERRAQMTAIQHIYPQFAPSPSPFPAGALELGGGFALLRATERTAKNVTTAEAETLRQFFTGLQIHVDENLFAHPRIARWARLRLPDGQTTRSLWKEGHKRLNDVRTSRQVKLHLDGKCEFGEVQYYFKLQLDAANGGTRGFAMVSLYSPPNEHLLGLSCKTVYSCAYLGQQSLRVVDVTSIESAVAVIPHSLATIEDEEVRKELHEKVFVLEKLGLDVMILGGLVEAESQVPGSGDDNEELD